MNRCIQLVDGVNDVKKICDNGLAPYLIMGSSYCLKHAQDRIESLGGVTINWRGDEIVGLEEEMEEKL